MLFGRKQKELEELIAHNADTISKLHTRLGEKNEQLLAQDKEIDALKAKASSGIACIEALIGRGIEWYDPSKLDYDAQVSYWNTAKSLVGNDVLQNEANHLIADLTKEGMTASKDYQHLYGLRMSINGIQTLLERLGEIPDPRKKESAEDLHSAI